MLDRFLGVRASRQTMLLSYRGETAGLEDTTNMKMYTGIS